MHKQRRINRRDSFSATLSRMLICILAITTLAGCSSRSQYDRLYASMEEEIIPDSNILEGRSIVIDPGHGGKFRGAIGMENLSEADVNLGVALYLWGMLEDAGAEVFMTRTTDRDFVSSQSEELKDDLENRMTLANSAEADVFISIHHNSSLPLKREKNRIEIYYKSTDAGASAELARIARLHLDRNLGIEKSVVKPGNYFILRNSNAGASILGEASYLSHPVVEDSLRLSSKQKLEAEAYFVALQEYFARGVPSLRLVSPAADTLVHSPGITYRFKSSIETDPSSARIFINDRMIIPSVEKRNGTIYYGLDSDAPNGRYTIRSQIRSVRGATGSSGASSFIINRKPAYYLPLPPEEEPGEEIDLSVKILDRHGNPIIDGSPVNITFSGSDKIIKAQCRGGICSFRVREDILPATFQVSAWGITDELLFEKPQPEEKKLISVENSLTGEAVPFPLIVLPGGGEYREGDSRGILRLDSNTETKDILVFSGGFKPYRIPGNLDGESGLTDRITLEPLRNGSLHGKRIVLDPACGGDYHGTIAENRIRESTVNIAVAERVQDLLESCGAEVTLTRNGEETVSAQERVARANRSRPDLAVSLHHDMDEAWENGKYLIKHYPGSGNGEKISNLIIRMLKNLFPPGTIGITESADLFLTQTTCPASEIHLGSLSGKDAGRILANPGYRYRLSECIFSAVGAYFDRDPACSLTPFVVRAFDGGVPLTDSYITVDNFLTLPADRNGSARFSHIEEGEHVIIIHRRGETVYTGIHQITRQESILTIDLENRI